MLPAQQRPCERRHRARQRGNQVDAGQVIGRRSVRDAAGRGPVTCQRLGRYAFILLDLLARGELRPLRNPAIVDDES